MKATKDIWPTVVEEFRPVKDILHRKLGAERDFAICLLRELKVDADKDRNLKLAIRLTKDLPGLGISRDKKRLRDICLRNPAPLRFENSLRKPGSYSYKSGPPFRWASAGCLPLFRIEGEHYAVFFLRGVAPLGWNVANGASEDAEEFWHLQRIITREFKEELLVLSTKGFVYRLEPPDQPGVSIAKHRRKVLRMWNLKAELHPDAANVKEFNGLDEVEIRADWDRENTPRVVRRVFVSINPEDGEMGIEVLKVMEWELEGGLAGNVFYDGEISPRPYGGLKGTEHLVKRPVGLFNVDDLIRSFQENDFPSARPTMVFYEGKPLEGGKLKSWCEKTPHSAAWCPVAIKTLRRLLHSPEIRSQLFAGRSCSCFLSYSSQDQALAKRLYADLQKEGVPCWFAPEDLKIGDRFRKKIDSAIGAHEKMLLLLSSASVASDWVEKEVETAFDFERRDKRTILFPIRLDDAVMDAQEGWAADIRRTRQIGDFTRWKHRDAYSKAFAGLLRDLNAAAKATAIR